MSEYVDKLLPKCSGDHREIKGSTLVWLASTNAMANERTCESEWIWRHRGRLIHTRNCRRCDSSVSVHIDEQGNVIPESEHTAVAP